MEVIGTLIVESLAPGANLTVPLTLRRMHRMAIERPATGQPDTWTLIDFSCPEGDVAAFADELAVALHAGPWYVDMATATKKFVIFAGKVFVFPRNDDAANQRAVDHARAVGIPEAQLDWPR